MFHMDMIKEEFPENTVTSFRRAIRGVIWYEGRLLMVETSRGDYKFPGGGMEEGEDELTTLFRETAEETGYVDIEVGSCIGTTFEQNEDTEEAGVCFQMESVYYSCRLKSLKRAPGVLDDYEEKLGFHAVFVEVAAAWEKNRKIQEKSDFAEIPWIERETKVLAVLKDARPTTP